MSWKKIYQHIHNHDKVFDIYLDLQKAFDTANCEILLLKLQYYGIKGIVMDWLKNYLQNRKQSVYINTVHYNTDIINCGVPQGSVVFGPLLFLLYVSDIENCVPDILGCMHMKPIYLFVISLLILRLMMLNTTWLISCCGLLTTNSIKF